MALVWSLVETNSLLQDEWIGSQSHRWSSSHQLNLWQTGLTCRGFIGSYLFNVMMSVIEKCVHLLLMEWMLMVYTFVWNYEYVLPIYLAMSSSMPERGLEVYECNVHLCRFSYVCSLKWNWKTVKGKKMSLYHSLHLCVSLGGLPFSHIWDIGCLSVPRM